MAALGTRIAALVVDWAFACIVGICGIGGPGALGRRRCRGHSWAVPVAWAVIGVVCVWCRRRRAERSDRHGRSTPTSAWDSWSLVRVIFIFFLIPPLVQDEDGRECTTAPPGPRCPHPVTR